VAVFYGETGGFYVLWWRLNPRRQATQKNIQVVMAMVFLAANQVPMAMEFQAARTTGLLHTHVIRRSHRHSFRHSFMEAVECASLVQLFLCDWSIMCLYFVFFECAIHV
jgi:hypothetical protein